MKNGIGGDIIIIEVKFDMERDEFLLSTAMLSSIWEEGFTDSIDLLIGFVKYVIGQSTNINDELDLKSIHTTAKKYLYIPNIPEQIIEEILDSLTKNKYNKILFYDKRTRKYYLNKDLSEYVTKFDEKIDKQKIGISSVFDELDTFYNSKARKTLTQDELKHQFFRFLSNEGFDFLRTSDTPNTLRKITSDNGQCFYLIAQFILNLYDTRSYLYDTVLKITMGFFLSKSIYLDSSKNHFKKNPPLKDLNIYIDTTLLLYILDCKTDYQHQSAMSMVNLLLENGASLFYYQHNLEEVKEIITKYKRNKHRSNARRTLERFDEENYSDIQIDLFYGAIEEKLKDKGIYIAHTQSYDKHDYVIDEKGLSVYLSEKIAGYKDKENILEHDIKSISSICIERKGITVSNYENLSCIWVTSNTKLVKYTKKFFEKEYKNCIFPIISDRKLTTDLWIKYGNKKNNVFELFLLENALLAIEPTEEVITKFIDNVEKFEKMNIITPETASLIRINCINDKNLMLLTDGDPERMTEQTANELIEGYKEKIIADYKKEQKKEIKQLQNEYLAKNKLQDETIAQKNAENSEKDKQIKKLNEQIQNQKKKEERQLRKVDQDANNSANTACKWIKRFIYSLSIIIALSFTVEFILEIIELINGNGNFLRLTIFVLVAIVNISFLVIDLIGIASSFKKIKQKLFYSIKSKYYKKYLGQYNKYHNK